MLNNNNNNYNNNYYHNNNNNNNKVSMHIWQGKVYLAIMGLHLPTSHWIRSVLGSLCVLNNNNNNDNNNNNNNNENHMHIRQGKLYLAAVGLNVPTTHWISSILGSLYMIDGLLW